MLKERKIIYGIIFAIIILVSFYFDFEIVFLISLIRNPFLNNFFMGLTFISSEIIIFFFLTSLFLWKENKARWILPLWVTLGLSTIISFLLKSSVQRLRPYQIEGSLLFPIFEQANHLTWNFSFPSLHAMIVFCAVPILSKEFPRFKYFWIVFASLVGFSRIYFGVHFLSDVLIGALIGCLIGIIIIKIEKEKEFGKKFMIKIKKKFKK